ncbi:MAG: hypothetical protein K9H06_05750 [Melioribacteraceae bacterium]|nr:hypothetical protein [Melioribacteraceae bacterium]MCF8419245.1 hypothetical protein [Melioribacteraceae bacterium]
MGKAKKDELFLNGRKVEWVKRKITNKYQITSNKKSAFGEISLRGQISNKSQGTISEMMVRRYNFNANYTENHRENAPTHLNLQVSTIVSR